MMRVSQAADSARRRLQDESERRSGHALVERGPEPLWLGSVAVAVGLGLLVIAYADTIAREGSRSAQPLFWLGLAILWIPATIRLIGRDAQRSERITLVVLVGMALYVVEVLYSPQYFTGFDELAHLGTANSIFRTGTLFGANSVLPVSPLFPGLEIVTTAVAKLTGLSVHAAGVLTIGAARLVMIMALYLVYERVGRSRWLASVATAAYFTNPQFLFFDSTFAYESLAIGLSIVVLYLVARGVDPRSDAVIGQTSAGDETPGGGRNALLLLIIPVVVATVITHHVTSYILAVTLVMTAAVGLWFSPRAVARWLWAIAGIAALVTAAYTLIVGNLVITYLAVPISGGLHELVSLIAGEGSSRRLFTSSTAFTTPLWERVVAFAFALITVLPIPLAWLRIRRLRRLDTLTVAFIIGSVAYPISGILHFTALGAELGDRLTAFVFVPVALFLAIVAWQALERFPSRITALTIVFAGALLMCGGAVLAAPAWLRMPGPYLVGADDRSVGPEGIAAASWAGRHLGPGLRIGADRVNGALMLAYGGGQPLTSLADNIEISPMFFDSRMAPSDLALLRQGEVAYLVLDYRMTRGLPWDGFYFDSDEPGANAHKMPISREALNKFEHIAGVSEVYDSGNIMILDVRRLSGA